MKRPYQARCLFCNWIRRNRAPVFAGWDALIHQKQWHPKASGVIAIIEKVERMTVCVTEAQGRFKIEGRHGRYEGLTILETKQCGLDCGFFREANDESVVGVCVKGVAWKVIVECTHRELWSCAVNRIEEVRKRRGAKQS